MSMPNELAPTRDLIDDMSRGRMVILVDDEDRENEGDIIVAADVVTPEIVNFMVREARGLVCLTLTPERCRRLDLKPMVECNTSQHETAFTVSIEAARGVSTGISAQDRAHTIRTAVARDADAADIVRPGHIFPLCAKPGGVLERCGHTEAGTDLARLAGFEPASVICEIMREDGTMARLPDLLAFGRRHGIRVGTIKDLVAYRQRHDARAWISARRAAMSDFGPFERVTFRDGATHAEHVALVRGNPDPSEPISVYLDACGADTSWIDASLADPQGALAQMLFSRTRGGTSVGCAVLLMLNRRGRPAAGTGDRDTVSQILSHLHVAHPVFVDVDVTHMQVALAA